VHSGAASGLETPVSQSQWRLSIQREPLGRALSDLARQLDIQIAQFSDPESASILVGPVRGYYSRQQALDLVLKGSGWSHQFINDRTVAIVRLSASAPHVSEAPQPSSLQAIDDSLPCSTTEQPADGHGDAEPENVTQPSHWSRFMQWIRRGSQSRAGAEPEGNQNAAHCPPHSASDPSAHWVSPDKTRASGCAQTPYWVAVLCAAVPLSGMAQGATGETASGGAAQAAADELQEVLVTAERRTTDLQKTAASVSVRSGQTLVTEGKYSLAQILEDVPGVSGGAALSSGGSQGAGSDTSGSGLTIRGIPSNIPVGGSVDSIAPAAAVYVDGVYEGVGGSYDIDRVEVLRGPQGTLYGRSATTGLVATHTADPALDNLGGNALVEIGNYDLRHFAGALNIPLVNDVLAIRVSGNRYQRDGYFEDKGVGGGLDTTDGRVKVLFKPIEDLSILLGAALENNIPQSVTAPTLSAPNTFQFAGQPQRNGYDNYRQYWGQLDWNFGFGTLTYLPAFRTWTSDTLVSVSVAAFLGPSFNQFIDVPSDHFTTQELRLASNAGSKLTWQVGAFYYLNTLSSKNTFYNTAFTPPALYRDRETVDKETYAPGVFGEVTYSPWDAWRITGGLRNDYTRVIENLSYGASFTNPPGPLTYASLSGAAGTRKFNNTTYRVRVEHDLTPSNLLYASVSTGFQPGDVTVTTSAQQTALVYNLKAETLRAYEIGSKNRFLNERLQINGDVYFNDYSGYQEANTLVILGAPPNLQLTNILLNSPAQVLGAEVETIFQMTSDDRLGFDFGLTNAYWVGKNDNLVANPAGGTTTFGNFYALNGIPGVVPFTANVKYDHSLHLPGGTTIKAHGDVRYRSPHDDGVISAAQLASGDYAYIRVGGEVVGDLSASWLVDDGKFSVTGYVRNVGDNEYKTNVGLAVSAGATPYDPRTYGVVLSARL